MNTVDSPQKKTFHACLALTTFSLVIAVALVAVDRYKYHDDCLRWNPGRVFVLNNSYSIETKPVVQNCQPTTRHAGLDDDVLPLLDCHEVSELSPDNNPITHTRCRQTDLIMCDVYTDMVVVARTFYALMDTDPIVIVEVLSSSSQWQCGSIVSLLAKQQPDTLLVPNQNHFYKYDELLSMLDGMYNVVQQQQPPFQLPVRACMQQYHDRVLGRKRKWEIEQPSLVYYYSYRRSTIQTNTTVIDRTAFLEHCTTFEFRQKHQLSFVGEVARVALGLCFFLICALIFMCWCMHH